MNLEMIHSELVLWHNGRLSGQMLKCHFVLYECVLMAGLLVILHGGCSSITLPLSSQETFELQLHFAATEMAEENENTPGGSGVS